MIQLQTMISTRVGLMLQGGFLPSLEREEGQTLVEYALILVLIAITVSLALIFLSTQINSIFTTIGNSL